MRLGIIGVGVVGGVLKRYFEEHCPQHEVKCLDPAKGMTDNLEGCEAIFVSVPVPAAGIGQDLKQLESAVFTAKKFTRNVFIRSTVLPGTNDRLGTFSMPEFLTERSAYEDFKKLPIVVGYGHQHTEIEIIFPDHGIIVMSNAEAELSKFAHNCFGAMKVSYFNLVFDLCRKYNADFELVKSGAGVTGFIDMENHTQVPGPDGKRGFGGKCFPENVNALKRKMYWEKGLSEEAYFFEALERLNNKHRVINEV